MDSICTDEEVLFIVSAGNINKNDIWKQYPTGNLLCPVEDPAQSWNALTVGAFTELDQLTDPNLRKFRAVAKKGELSPYSTTGADFESQWPAKPDILFEGGNVLLAPDSECYSGEDDLSILTTSHEINRRLLTTTWATSAATAKMSAFSAILQSEYSDFWSETIRGLIIHSAQWTDGMRDQFEDFGIDLSKKSGYQRALKIFGNGVPSLKKARYSADNNLSLIVESKIQPFEKHKANVRFKELHVYGLPWPKETLLELGEAEVELKVTLSDYIEPMPGNRGYTDKYRYGSHQLEFQLSNPGEDAEAFSLRMGEKLDDNDPRDVR